MSCYKKELGLVGGSTSPNLFSLCRERAHRRRSRQISLSLSFSPLRRRTELQAESSPLSHGLVDGESSSSLSPPSLMTSSMTNRAQSLLSRDLVGEESSPNLSSLSLSWPRRRRIEAQSPLSLCRESGPHRRRIEPQSLFPVTSGDELGNLYLNF